MKLFKDKDNQIFAFDDDGSQDFLIKDGLVSISVEEANLLIQEKQKQAFDSLSYQQKRAAEYPSFLDYLDGIVKGDTAQVQAYIDACLAVKAKYPKA